MGSFLPQICGVGHSWCPIGSGRLARSDAESNAGQRLASGMALDTQFHKKIKGPGQFDGSEKTLFAFTSHLVYKQFT